MPTLDLPSAPVPPRPTRQNLHEAAQDRRAYDLWEGATQGVIARYDVYITNAIDHFRYRLRGERRIHQAMGQFVADLSEVAKWLRAR